VKVKIFIFLFFLTLFPKIALANENGEISFYAEKLNISRENASYLMTYAKEKNVPFDIVFALLSVETGGTFDSHAVGPPTRFGRAYGVAQFMENTAPWIAKIGGLHYSGRDELFDPVYSTQLAITYLHYLYYGGPGHNGYYNWHATLTAYNRGVYGFEKYKLTNKTAVSVYSAKILNSKDEF
jgi:soluble lytic murein transglycosylase-like protein